ncbi:hypothetical protein V8F20_008283 [Naviculisporaceae sp. PSN 640]
MSKPDLDGLTTGGSRQDSYGELFVCRGWAERGGREYARNRSMEVLPQIYPITWCKIPYCAPPYKCLRGQKTAPEIFLHHNTNSSTDRSPSIVNQTNAAFLFCHCRLRLDYQSLPLLRNLFSIATEHKFHNGQQQQLPRRITRIPRLLCPFKKLIVSYLFTATDSTEESQMIVFVNGIEMPIPGAVPELAPEIMDAATDRDIMFYLHGSRDAERWARQEGYTAGFRDGRRRRDWGVFLWGTVAGACVVLAAEIIGDLLQLSGANLA